MEIRILFSLSIILVVILILTAPCSCHCIYAVASLLLPFLLFLFSPLCSHHFSYCLAAILVIVLFKAHGTRSIRQTRGAQKGGLSHPTEKLAHIPLRGEGLKQMLASSNLTMLKGERKQRQRYAVVDEQGQWWLLA